MFAIALTGCVDWGAGEYCEGDWAAAPAEDPAPATTQARVAQVLSTSTNAVDILFVIDDSSSMTDEQQQLGIWANEMFDVLGTRDGGDLPDLHIGVVSSSVAIAGIKGCEANGGFHAPLALGPNKFLVDVAGPNGRERNYTGTLAEAFAGMARVGDTGCGYEQTFEAAKRALSYGPKDFLRADAVLLVVFVTDEDDCSSIDDRLFRDPHEDACGTLGTLTSYRCFEHGVTCHDGQGSRVFGERQNCRPAEDSPYVQSVATFARYLRDLKRDPAQVVVAGIYGKPNGIRVVPDERITTYQTPRLASSCNAGMAEGVGAAPAVRMNALMAEFGGHASQSSICDPDLAWAMRDVGLVARDVATQSHCLRGAIATESSCRVYAARPSDDRRARPIEIPRCTRGLEQRERCFTIERDDVACGHTETGLTFRIHADADDGSTMSVSCDVANDL